MHTNQNICKLCRYISKVTLRKLSDGISILPLCNNNSYNNKEFNFVNELDIKNIQYKDVMIGYAVLSSYITYTRNPNPLMDINNNKKISYLLNQCARLVDKTDEIIEDINFDAVYLYNGRLFETRPLMDLSVKKGIPFYCNEVKGGPRSDESYLKVQFKNSLSHDVKNNYERIKYVWNNSSLSDSEKREIGESFYTNRRNGIPAGDIVYTNSQIEGKLPAGWNNEKTNIVFFNSSEDEFSALGKEFDQYSLFPSQLEGIESIINFFQKDDKYHFYLRVHPNLRNVQFSYHTELYLLPNKYKNITVIPAADSVSTYDLMDKADKIIVFGSTMGAEASYWGLPVILLAGSFYYFSDICYIPNTIEELRSQIESPLPPKNKENAIRYGYYLLDDKVLARESEYMHFSPKLVRLFGKSFYVFPYLSILHSSLLMKFFITFFLKFFKKINIHK